MKVVKTIGLILAGLAIIYVGVLFVYGIIWGDKVDWTKPGYRNKWHTYVNSNYNFSFEYPPVINIKEEDSSQSVIENAKLLLSFNDRGEVWGTVHVVSSSVDLRSKNYDHSEKIMVNGIEVDKEINFTNDKSKVASLTSDIIIPAKPDLKIHVSMGFLLNDDDTKRALKEKYFDNIVSSLKFQ